MTRRLVLLDFDWQDADLMPRLLHEPGVSIRLVVGRSPEDAGVRMATLCGLPHSIELPDLTREIFDLAVVGERSARREALERLLRALGTPTDSVSGFLRARDTLAPGATAEPVAAADALPVAAGASMLPGPEDTRGLEQALAGWVAETSAASATLHLAGDGAPLLVCRCGPEDPLLESLVQLAFRLDAPQVMLREDGTPRGQMWGAWPLRTPHRRAVLAVAAAAAQDARRAWETAAQSLGTAWSVVDPGPPAETPSSTLLPPETFSRRLQLAVERHRTEGFRFALYRLTLDAPEPVVTGLLRELAERLRGTDCVCRPAPQDLLLLCAGPPQAYGSVRNRIELLWRQAWVQQGKESAPPPIVEERLPLAGAEGAEDFIASGAEAEGGAGWAASPRGGPGAPA